MTHGPDQNYKGLGFKCECGERFVSEEKLGEHILYTHDDPVDEPNKEETQPMPDEQAPAEQPQEQPETKAVAPAPTTAGKIATSPLKQTANMVAQYATKLTNNERAQQFYAQVSIMAQNQPDLAKVDPTSLLSAVMACVHLDLMPNTPEQYAFVIPYGKQAQFQIGYKGLLELAYRTANISSINAELVFEGDEFRVELGTQRELIHRPSFNVDRTNYNKVTHAYATAVLKDGSTVFEVLSREELNKVQATVKSSSSDTPWKKWPEAMAKKTAVKRLTKLLPGSAEDNRLKYAVELDSRAEAGKLRFINGEVVEEANPSVPDHVRVQIEEASTKEELKAILDGLDVKDRKHAAGLVAAKLKEL